MALPQAARPADAPDLSAWRDEFPVVGRKAYLISASLGPLSRRSRAYLDEYLEAWEGMGAPEPVWFGSIFPRIRRVKELWAELIGADADELAVMTNVSQALSTVASCLSFDGERRRVVLSELDFPAEGQVWLAQERRGAEVVVLPSPDGVTVPLESYAEAIDERTAVVCLNRVLYRSAALLDAGAVCRIAREAGALSVVDDYHGAGVVPVDVHALGCDLYTAGVLKWLCGGPGLAVLYARRDVIPRLEPTLTGWWARSQPFGFGADVLDYHPTARRFEIGTHPAPVPYLAQGGLEIVLEVGPARIRERQGELTDYVIERADAAGLAVRTPRDRDRRGGTVNLGVGGDAHRVAEELYARDVCVDARADGIRVAPHFFSVADDVDRLFDALAAIR